MATEPKRRCLGHGNDLLAPSGAGARVPYTTAGSSGLPDHLEASFSQPVSVTATVSSWRIPSSP